MRHRVGKDFFPALMVLVLGLFILWESKDFNRLSAVFPQTVGGILAGLGFLDLLRGLFRPVSSDTKKSMADGKRIWVMIASMAGYATLIGLIGFLPATLLFIGFSTWFLQGPATGSLPRLKRAVLFAGTVSAVFFLLFRYVFLVPFPEGMFLKML